MKVALVQLEPVYGDIDASCQRADELLSEFSEASNVDLVVLPEMALTGYQFKSKEHILPLAEVEGEGKTFHWASKVSRKLKSGVCCGYVRKDKSSGLLFNSMIVVNPKGEFVTSYDKHFLYETDKTWASPGAGFVSLELDWIDAKIGLGICMDINPFDFTAPFSAFEFSNFHKANKSEVIIFSSAWCNRHPGDLKESEINGVETIQYWCTRLYPLIGQDVYFVIADRVGSEPLSNYREEAKGRVSFCGSSCVLNLKHPSLVACLDTKEEGVLVVDIPVVPPA
mmetsp:Transcript_8859/g.14381  ORF Transcript_8859/g.14381 Transcript_8859/m.14381 type:complete len:282 (+) Transcript_8859:305-1150(+)|eukprot:CAMPEP_0203750784 /NCGR_PEP_ID=MMETSP0098-20131031/4960_1 /ASSEMBLY_ACC=CAM_ASM_000208 /TAXON_ID=96639 /ORGANISM=" , Strain NY0313808BC1" /LENGTH=281 /DNA_ID=CAMNT_0050640225 /DNA_START=378 /DNA_END=1223 /DNA_ORIENTATION=+